MITRLKGFKQSEDFKQIQLVVFPVLCARRFSLRKSPGNTRYDCSLNAGDKDNNRSSICVCINIPEIE